MKPNPHAVIQEQNQCLALLKEGKTIMEIAEIVKISYDQARRRIRAARRREKMDPELVSRLDHQGLTDYSGLHSGWLIEKDANGAGHSLYFHLGSDDEKISFADAMMEVLSDIPRLDPIALVQPKKDRVEEGKDYATWIALADLHVGGDYGDVQLEKDFTFAIDDLVSRLPPAEHAVLFELGDLLEANDHKGVTPQSGNLLDVRRENHLGNTLTAVKLMRHAIYRLLETHPTVEVHLVKGNHDPTAYIAVMLGLAAHFEENPRVKIIVEDWDYRVVTWGLCAAFPNHGDKATWNQLKDIWADQFPDEWAAAKAHRIIMTAHYHHDRKRDLVGCVAEHYRTLHRPNNWAKGKGLFSRGSLTAMTVHRDRGEEYRTIANIRNKLKGE
jgi:hypothetical protein